MSTLTLNVASSFTAEPLQPHLERLWQAVLQLPSAEFAVSFAGFGQVVQTLLDQGSMFHSATGSAANVVLVRAKDMGADGFNADNHQGWQRTPSLRMETISSTGDLGKQCGFTSVVGSTFSRLHCYLPHSRSSRIQD